MSVNEAMQILKTIKFLNFGFAIKPISEHACWLNINIVAPDTRDRCKMIDLVHQQMIPSLGTMKTKDFVLFVYDCVIKVLRHEASELFTANGIDVFNEHDEPQQKIKVVEAMFGVDQSRIAHMYHQMSYDQREKDYNMHGALQHLRQEYLKEY